MEYQGGVGGRICRGNALGRVLFLPIRIVKDRFTNVACSGCGT